MDSQEEEVGRGLLKDVGVCYVVLGRNQRSKGLYWGLSESRTLRERGILILLLRGKEE